MTMYRSQVIDSQLLALPTIGTASGSIATFDTDMTENLVEVLCQIVAKQASGTPTPDNPLLIGVYDSLTLYHNDVNMWNEQWEVGGISNTTGENIPNANMFRTTNYIPVKPNATYYLVMPSTTLGFRYYGIDKSFQGTIAPSVSQAITIPSNVYYLRFVCTTTNTYGNNISLNYPSTDTQYHAFNGAYIPFGQTVANGVLDVTTGKLRVTHEIVDLGSLNYSQGFSGFYTTGIKDFIEIPSTVAGSQLLCSIFSVGNTANNDNMYIQFAPSYLGWVVFLPSTSYATASDFKTAMSGINLVYKLATPIEIQLDSKTITALLNENNIWCDTGDTEVKYLLTVGKKIA